MGSKEFAGMDVLITGAGGGLGSALIALFKERGARITGCDQSAESLANLDVDRRITFDLSDRAAAETAATEIARDGLPDIIVNNAGWTRAETMPSLDASKIGAEVDINLTGVITFTNALLAGMVQRGSGNVVFVSSVNALLHFGNPAYAAAKAGINAFARAIAVEYGRFGIRANVVCPGSIRTPAWDHRLQRDPEIPGKLKKLYPLERLVEPTEVAEAVAFLASRRAGGITGVTLPVDAGLTAGSLPFIDGVLG